MAEGNVKKESVEVEKYNFSNPNRIPKDHIESLQRIHEKYSESLGTSLSTFLRTEVMVALDKVEQVSFQDYLQSLMNPTCIGSFDMQPLNGVCAIEVNSILIFSMIDRMLGGNGKVPDVSRSFTDIELSISQKVLRNFLDTLSEAWKQVLTLQFNLKEVQTNPSFTRSIPMREICLVTSLKMNIGETSGMVSLCFPYVNLEPIGGKLKSEEWSSSMSNRQSLEVQEAHQKNFMNVSLDVEAHLGKANLSMSELLMLQSGDILNLGGKARHPIDVSVNGVKKFKAVPGLSGRYKAIGIHSLVTEE